MNALDNHFANLQEIENCINNIEDVTITKPFLANDFDARGFINVSIESLNVNIDFEVLIYCQYPFRTHDNETIKFINKDLLSYNHVMADGAVCIHTSHCVDLMKKIKIDIGSLKNWILKYYVNQETDSHYEHIIVPESNINNISHAFLFTEIDYSFKKNDIGLFRFTALSSGNYFDKEISNFIVQYFELDKKKYFCQWNKYYNNINDINNVGIFIFIETPPTINKRFIIKNWKELEPYLNQSNLNFLHLFQSKRNNHKERGKNIPLLIGYKIPSGEIHWQATLIEIGKFPINGVKVGQRYNTECSNNEINWVLTRNCSYKYFFGRGTLSNKITDNKILIIGIGAIGSIIATTLVRGGCTKIDLIDHDIKDIENVCRSEYKFKTGIKNKIDDLSQNLFDISPFIDINFYKQEFLELYSKALYKNKECKDDFSNLLNSYDLIFDCSTDNDLMYILDEIKIHHRLTFAITNNAKELVCATGLNSYEWTMNQFENVLENNLEDLYNPTGCWNPTFKASYNDINTLVQFAIKHINIKYEQDKPLNNFVLETNTENGFNIKLKEF